MSSNNLERGANASITRAMQVLSPVTIGFSWDLVRGNDYLAEIVPCAIVCGTDGRAISSEHVVFFNQMLSPDKCVQYDGDGGLPGGDIEQIEVDLPGIPENVAAIALVLYANPDLRGPNTFDAMSACAIRVLDQADRELLRYAIDTTDLHMTNAIVAAELYRRGDEWKFRAVGQGYTDGIVAVADDFGFLAS